MGREREDEDGEKIYVLPKRIIHWVGAYLHKTSIWYSSQTDVNLIGEASNWNPILHIVILTLFCYCYYVFEMERRGRYFIVKFYARYTTTMPPLSLYMWVNFEHFQEHRHGHESLPFYHTSNRSLASRKIIPCLSLSLTIFLTWKNIFT